MPDWEIVIFNSSVIIVFHKVPYDARLAGGTKQRGANKESMETKAASDSLKSTFRDDFWDKKRCFIQGNASRKPWQEMFILHKIK